MLNIVVIGTGSIALSRHIPSVQKSQNAHLFGVYNRTKEKAQKIAKEYGCKLYHSLNEIYEDPEVDAVIICTPPDSHCEITVNALEHNKHVLVEKPMSVTAKEAKIMMNTSKKTGKKLMVSHNQRLYRPHQKAKELIERGEIGKILTYRTCLGLPLKQVGEIQPEWKNVIGEVGSHRIDLMRYILGEDIEEVFGHLFNVYQPESTIDDNAMVLLKHTNNITGSLIVSRTSYGESDRMTQIYGTEGKITLYAETNAVVVEKGINEKATINFADLPPQSVVEVTDIVERFISSVLYDSDILVPPEDGYQVMLALDAIRLSNREKRWVSLSEFIK